MIRSRFVMGAGLALIVALPVAAAQVTITAAGSTALLPLVKAAAGQYQAKHPDVNINVSGGGSGVGLTQVASKSIDIGNSDIPAPPGSAGLVDHKVAVIGFAIVANPGVNVKNLTKAQVIAIFSGKTTNWKDVGGADVKVVVINRPRSSGTRAVFTKTMMGGTPLFEGGLVQDATGTVVTTVKGTPGAVSYAANSGTRNQPVQELSIDGVAPTDANIIDGKYPIWSYEHMFTNGPPSKPVADFIAFVAANTALLKRFDYIQTGAMKVTANDR